MKKILLNFFCFLMASLVCFGEGTNATLKATRKRKCQVVAMKCLDQSKIVGEKTICGSSSQLCILEYGVKCNPTLDFSVVHNDNKQEVLSVKSSSESKAKSEVQATYSNQSIERNPTHEREIMSSGTVKDMTYECSTLDNSISQTTPIGGKQALSSNVVDNISGENKIQDASSVHGNTFVRGYVVDSSSIDGMKKDEQTRDRSLVFGSDNFLGQTLDSTIANSTPTNAMETTIDKSCNEVMIANTTSTSYDRAFCSSVNSAHSLECIGVTYGTMQTHRGTSFNDWLGQYSPIGFNSSMSFEGFAPDNGTFAVDAKYLQHNIGKMSGATQVTPNYPYSDLGFGSSFREAMRILNDNSTSDEQKSRINDRMFKAMLLQQRIQESRSKLK